MDRTTFIIERAQSSPPTPTAKWERTPDKALTLARHGSIGGWLPPFSAAELSDRNSTSSCSHRWYAGSRHARLSPMAPTLALWIAHPSSGHLRRIHLDSSSVSPQPGWTYHRADRGRQRHPANPPYLAVSPDAGRRRTNAPPYLAGSRSLGNRSPALACVSDRHIPRQTSDRPPVRCRCRSRAGHGPAVGG